MIKRAKAPAIISGAFLLALAFWPTYATWEQNTPKEESKYIRRIYDQHTVGQKITPEHKTSAIQVLVRAQEPTTATLILSVDNQIASRVEADLTTEDQWIRLKLNQTLSANNSHTLTFSVDPPLNREQAALVRFQIDSDRYGAGHMTIDDKESYGDLAFKLEQRVPAAQKLLIWGQVTDGSIKRGLSKIAAAFFIAPVLLLCLTYLPTKHYLRYIIPLSLLALLAIIIRVPYLQQIEGVFGGDAFNYLSKTQALLHGEDLFAADPRKGPVLSILLAPGYLTPNPLLFSRIIGIMAAAASTVMLPLIGRALRLSWPASITAGLLLAVNPEFIWESPSALANTLFVCLILGSTLLYLKATTPKQGYILAALLGLVALTRYEGALFAAVLLPALWFRQKYSLKHGLLLLAIAAIVMATPLVSIVWSGSSGIRTPADINNDSGLLLARSVESLKENSQRLQQYTEQAWIIVNEKNRHNHVLPAMILGLLVGITLSYKQTKIGLIYIPILIFFIITKSSNAREYLIAIPFFLTALGVPLLIKRKKYDTATLLLVVALHVIAITVILPKPRYYLPITPFMALFMVAGFANLTRSKHQSALTLTFATILASFIYFDSLPAQAKRVEKYNNDASISEVMINAALYLRQHPGNTAFRNDGEPPVETLIPRSRRFYFKGRQADIPAEEKDFFQKNAINYAIEREGGYIFKTIHQNPDQFPVIKTFTSKNGPAKVTIYQVGVIPPPDSK